MADNSKLSKNLLGLKFMQRAEAAAQEAQQQTEPKASKSITPAVHSGKGPRIQLVSSFSAIDEPSDLGHMSFRNFNEDVQRTMREMKDIKAKAQGESADEDQENPKKQPKVINYADADVSDEAAAKRYADFIKSSTKAKEGRKASAESTSAADTGAAGGGSAKKQSKKQQRSKRKAKKTTTD